MKINICAETIEQIHAVTDAAVRGSIKVGTPESCNQRPHTEGTDSAAIETIYLDIRYVGAREFKETVESIRAAGLKAGLRLPGISRKKGRQYLSSIAVVIEDAGFDSFIFGNIEDLILFKDLGLLKDRAFSTDYFIYCFNKEAEAMLISITEQLGLKDGLKNICCPLELSLKELASVGYSCSTELVVYGRVPMMTSAQCIKNTVQTVGEDSGGHMKACAKRTRNTRKTAGQDSEPYIVTGTQCVENPGKGCDHKKELLYLKDRTGSLMPVKNACEFCINTIYNSVPMVLLDMENEISRLSPDYIRYEFTTESGKEVSDILNCRLPSAYTRGHAKRKIE